MKIVIVASGYIGTSNVYDDILKEADCIICADGGARFLLSKNIYPDILLGDFDSISLMELESIKAQGGRIYEYPPEKNFTDSELAISYAIEQKPSKVTMLGVTGTRLDHTLANIYLLSQFEDNGIEAYVVDDNNKISYMDAVKVLSLTRDANYKYLSLVPLTEGVGAVSMSGVKYPLVEKDLCFGETLSISNEVTEDIATVRKSEGKILVIQSRD